MSLYAYPDVLGAQDVTAPNLTVPLALRETVRFRGCADLVDEPAGGRTLLRCPSAVFHTVTVDAGELARTPTPWLEGISGADFIRLDSVTDSVVQGFADAVPMGSGFYAVRAVPIRPIKYVANVGVGNITLQPPATVPSDPNRAGLFIDSMSLAPNVTVRCIWDHEAGGYRIQGGQQTYLTFGGQYVVYNGQRIYLRS